MVLTRRFTILVALLGCGATGLASAQRMPVAGRGRSDGPRPLLFGFALECERCESSSPRGRGPLAVWHYSDYPRVVAVAPGGAAAGAGIREKDLIVAVDGLSLVTDEGAQRFSAVRMGDDVRLTLDREGKLIDVALTLGNRSLPLVPRRGQLDSPVYRGHAGAAAVEVWSDSPVAATTDSTGMLLLRIGGTTVRIRPSSPLPQSRKP